MSDEPRFLKPCTDPGQASAENGVVILDGPDGVAVTMTADAAEQTADSLRAAAMQARAEAARQRDGLRD
ncbi:hypothetical protein [Pseudorhodoferax soli]|uniref:Uncharacterized protein n=1 Tax=Pseudorhodoferax soli TaxID=545864 RepID=A0A368XWK1_9BURK|nr:hypothetical protein [Pseudorhodoferax soli]RCW71428.1 hypothetical protein DES41_104247 [Pseudorhodoferax soli]